MLTTVTGIMILPVDRKGCIKKTNLIQWWQFTTTTATIAATGGSYSNTTKKLHLSYYRIC